MCALHTVSRRHQFECCCVLVGACDHFFVGRQCCFSSAHDHACAGIQICKWQLPKNVTTSWQQRGAKVLFSGILHQESGLLIWKRTIALIYFWTGLTLKEGRLQEKRVRLWTCTALKRGHYKSSIWRSAMQIVLFCASHALRACWHAWIFNDIAFHRLLEGFNSLFLVKDRHSHVRCNFLTSLRNGPSCMSRLVVVWISWCSEALRCRSWNDTSSS